MFVIQINSIDMSCHSLEIDALVQKQRFIDAGTNEIELQIIETDSFLPPQMETLC